MTAVVSMLLLTIAYFSVKGASPNAFYTIIFLLGLPMGGLWAVFVTTASELFGTNIRATVTTTVPNFVRGATVLILLYLNFLKPVMGLWWAGILVGATCIVLSLVSIVFLEETYHKLLDYPEE